MTERSGACPDRLMDASPGKNSRAVGALEIIEEAFHLLRRCPAACLTSYYLGAVPFVLGFLFFWADMSHGVYASGRLLPAAMAVTVLYLFMKCLHADFTRRLKNQITGEDTRKLSAGRILRLVVLQSMYQPLGFIILPVALLFTVPFGWCFAFFQNVTVFGLEDGAIREIRRRALRQAIIWPVQNNLLLGILLLFSIFVMLNLMIAAFAFPHLVKMIFGIETVFSRSSIHMFNTTFFMTIAAMTYLCADPIIKAIYVLRCYYGEARKTGEDLAAELRIARMKREAVFPVIIFFACVLLFLAPVRAGENTDIRMAGPEDGITARQLEEAVTDVLGRVEYTWRTPRDRSEGPPPSGFLYEFFQMIIGWIGAVADWVEKVVEWIADMIRKLLPRSGYDTGAPSGWSGTGYAMIYFLLALGASAAAILIYRLIKSRKTGRKTQILETPVITAADLEDENIRADALPEEKWMTMARELLESGETRLAVRALYLAALAHLAAEGLITVAEYKSDREYEQELQGRGRGVQHTASSFSHIKAGFEVVWYGMHDVSRHGLDSFMKYHRQVMSHEVR